MYDGRVVFQVDADTKSFDNQIEKVEEELNDLINRYDETRAMKPFKGKEEDLRELGVEIEKTANKLKGLKQQQERVEQGTSSLGKESEKTGTQMSKGFEKGLKSVKKLALGIVGIRGAYMLARRAASAYMSADEDLAKKMQSVWTGLGAFLAPLLEMITNLMLKFVGYLNEFIKALTGTDYIARANAKALEKQAKAQAQLNKETEKYQNYDFDVIRTQQTNQSASGSSGSDTPSGLIEIPELNQGIVKKLQDLAKWLKENKDLIEAVGIALGITFGAVAIGKLLSNIAALIGSQAAMTGLLGLLAVLSLIAIVWTIKLVVDGIQDLKDTWDIYNRLVEEGVIEPQEERKKQVAKGDVTPEQAAFEQSLGSYQIYKKGMEGSSKFYSLGNFLAGGNKQGFKNNAQALLNYVKILIEYGKQNKLTADGYKDLLDFSREYGDYLDDMQKLTGDYSFDIQDLNSVIRNYGKEMDNNNGIMMYSTNAFKKQKTAVEETKTQFNEGADSANFYFETLNKTPKEKTTKINTDSKDAEQKAANYKKEILGLPSVVTTTIKATLDTSQADWSIQELVRKMNAGGFAANIFKSLGKLMGFAGGGYISQPTLAMVGEGKYNEYVIPEGEDYISRLASEIGRYGGGGGTTNIYLDGRLIQRQVNKTANRVSFTRNGR